MRSCSAWLAALLRQPSSPDQQQLHPLQQKLPAVPFSLLRSLDALLASPQLVLPYGALAVLCCSSLLDRVPGLALLGLSRVGQPPALSELLFLLAVALLLLAANILLSAAARRALAAASGVFTR